MAELRGLINDIIHPLLSSTIFIDDLLIENNEINKNGLLLIDSQMVSAINYLLEMRSIILYYVNHRYKYNIKKRGLHLQKFSGKDNATPRRKPVPGHPRPPRKKAV
jgi:hypothetical protein